MQTNEHYYSLSKDEYESLSDFKKNLLQYWLEDAKRKVNKAYSALAEVLVAEESTKGE